jgi:hypothetical protein
MELWQNGKVEFYHMLMKQYLFLFFLLLSSSIHAELPGSFTAIYALHYDDLRIGVMERRFTHNNDGSGTFESNGKLTGLAALFRKDKITESSRWEINDGQLRPVEYSYVRSGGKKEKNEQYLFDWKNNRVTSTTQDGKKELDLTPGLLDKLLYQLAMMEIRDPDAGLKYDLIDGTTFKTYQFEFKGEENLSTPMGKLKTLKFQRKRPDDDPGDNENKRSTILWCAPSLHYLPVRVDNVDRKGHLTSIVIKDVTGLN